MKFISSYQGVLICKVIYRYFMIIRINYMGIIVINKIGEKISSVHIILYIVNYKYYVTIKFVYHKIKTF